MQRVIALSNLSLGTTSIFGGPKAAWEAAQNAGFDAMKINPLRFWGAERIQNAGIKVSAFEAPWRYSFQESVNWAFKNGERSALLMDPLLFGYDPYKKKISAYQGIFADSTIVAVDWPWPTLPSTWRHALETDAEKYLLQKVLDAPQVLFDTWHMRGYTTGNYHGSPSPVYEEFDVDKVVAIDVQTRDVDEWLDFLEGSLTCLLRRQLEILAQTASTVSAALEIHPLHLHIISKVRDESRNQTLEALMRKIRTVLR
jgi:hypothetical protein